MNNRLFQDWEFFIATCPSCDTFIRLFQKSANNYCPIS
jgi:hypothetical protein